MNGLTIFDFVVIGILALMAIRGGLSGLVGQVVSLASIVVGWIVAARCNVLFGPLLPLEEPWNRYAAMILLFVGVWIGFRLLHAMICGVLKKWQIKEFDRQLGALVGLLKGIFVCMVITFFAVSLSEVTRSYVLASKSGHYLALLIDKTGALIPADMSKRLSAQIDQFRRHVAEEQGMLAEEKGEGMDDSPVEQGGANKTIAGRIFDFFASSKTDTANDSPESPSTVDTSSGGTVNDWRRVAEVADRAMTFYEDHVQSHSSSSTPASAAAIPQEAASSMTSSPKPLRSMALPSATDLLESSDAPVMPMDPPIMVGDVDTNQNVWGGDMFSSTPVAAPVSKSLTTTSPVRAFVPVVTEQENVPYAIPNITAPGASSASPAFDPQAWARGLMKKE